MRTKAANISAVSSICQERNTRWPSPLLAVTNSTAMTVMSASPRPSRRPVKMAGRVPGRMTLRKRPQAPRAVVPAHLDQARVEALHAARRAEHDLEERGDRAGQDEGRLAHAEHDEEQRQQRDLRQGIEERHVRLDGAPHRPPEAHGEAERHRRPGGQHEGGAEPAQRDERLLPEDAAGEQLGQRRRDDGRRREVARGQRRRAARRPPTRRGATTGTSTPSAPVSSRATSGSHGRAAGGSAAERPAREPPPRSAMATSAAYMSSTLRSPQDSQRSAPSPC